MRLKQNAHELKGKVHKRGEWKPIGPYRVHNSTGPIDGKIGKEAKALWSKYDHERPDYDTYVKRMKEREIKEEEIAKKAALAEKKRIEEEIKMTEELEKIDKETAIEDLKNLKNVR